MKKKEEEKEKRRKGRKRKRKKTRTWKAEGARRAARAGCGRRVGL